MTIKDSYLAMEKIVFKQITDLGGLIPYCIFLIMFLILGYNDIFWRLLISIISIMVIAVAIKISYFKRRPNKQKRTGNIVEKIDASSFPSIHAMRTLSLVFWLSIFFDNLVLTSYISIIGLLVIYSRIYLRKHYWSDVIFGMLFSLIINLAIWWIL